jgi:hypothetical protein
MQTLKRPGSLEIWHPGFHEQPKLKNSESVLDDEAHGWTIGPV